MNSFGPANYNLTDNCKIEMCTKQLDFKAGFSLESTPSFSTDTCPALKAILFLLSLLF